MPAVDSEITDGENLCRLPALLWWYGCETPNTAFDHTGTSFWLKKQSSKKRDIAFLH